MNTVVGWCLVAAGLGVLWLLIVFIRLMTRPSAMGGGKSAGSRAGRKAKGAVTPEAADTAPESTAPLSGATPTVARAALTPDCPTLDSEYWRANPIEPLAPSEVVRWNGIVARYEWVAPTAVVRGDS